MKWIDLTQDPSGLCQVWIRLVTSDLSSCDKSGRKIKFIEK